MTAMLSPATTSGSNQLDGWPVGAYDSYDDAQRAVGHLAGHDFPVTDVTIVGVEPMVVERISGRLTWRRVLGGGVASGAWVGVFVGLLMTLLTPGSGLLPLLIGLAGGVAFGVAFAALTYSTSKGRRNFMSHRELIARRYDVICRPRTAERARDLLAGLALAGPGSQRL